jgi:YD repeat-containing protein
MWNTRDQLTAMTGASFQYDGLGRRIGKTVGGWTTSYLHDGMNVVAQFGTQAATLLTGLASTRRSCERIPRGRGTF